MLPWDDSTSMRTGMAVGPILFTLSELIPVLCGLSFTTGLGFNLAGISGLCPSLPSVLALCGGFSLGTLSDPLLAFGSGLGYGGAVI